jgi:hypothetical protein
MIQAGARQKPNAHIIRPMKKILTTLTVIAAAALGAQGQTTTNFPAGPNTTTTFSGLTFTPGTNSLASPPYTRARLLFGVTGMTGGSDAPPTFGGIFINQITFSGQGLSGSVSPTPTSFSITRNLTDPSDGLGGGYSYTDFVALSPTVESWLPAGNLTGFTAQVYGSASMPVGSRIYYGLQYADNGNNLNTSFGNVIITPVPEPSTYAAAAGLLALFLWSSRRHLFKLAGARSSASGSGENGAA